MKKIETVLAHFLLDDIDRAFNHPGVYGVTVMEVKARSRRGPRSARYRGAEYTVNLVPALKVEVVVDDATAPKVVATLRTLARDTDGGEEIFVLPMASTARVGDVSHVRPFIPRRHG